MAFTNSMIDNFVGYSALDHLPILTTSCGRRRLETLPPPSTPHPPRASSLLLPLTLKNDYIFVAVINKLEHFVRNILNVDCLFTESFITLR